MGGRRGMGVTGRHLMKTVTPSPGVAWRATARAPRRRPLLGRPDSESESDPPGPGCRVRRQWPRAGGGRLKNWAPPRSLKPLLAGGGDLVADQRTTQSLPAAGNGVPAPGRR